jgi:hypothetical protein
VLRGDLDVADAGAAERLLLHRVAGGGGALVVALALGLDDGDPARRRG